MTTKYRAWDSVRKAMIDKVAVYHHSGNSVMVRPTALNYSVGKNWQMDNFGFLYSDDGSVIPMQYTGLKDKNGVEIYAKCDVLETKGHRDTIELGWSIDDQYGFIWSKSRNIVIRQDFIDERYKVIGNIYENPELLNKEGDTK